MISNMTEQSWLEWQKQWDETPIVDELGNNLDFESEDDFELEEIPNLTVLHKDTTSTIYSYLREVGNGTPKARFFLIKDGLVKYGFWCPRSVVVDQTDDTVEIKNWCQLKVIEYTR